MGLLCFAGIASDARVPLLRRGLLPAKVLIERSNTSHVQLKMSRVKVILVVVMPALFLLVSADCFGDLTTGRGCNSLRCLLSSRREPQTQVGSADNSFESTVQRWAGG